MLNLYTCMYLSSTDSVSDSANSCSLKIEDRAILKAAARDDSVGLIVNLTQCCQWLLCCWSSWLGCGSWHSFSVQPIAVCIADVKMLHAPSHRVKHPLDLTIVCLQCYGVYIQPQYYRPEYTMVLWREGCYYPEFHRHWQWNVSNSVTVVLDQSGK